MIHGYKGYEDILEKIDTMTQLDYVYHIDINQFIDGAIHELFPPPNEKNIFFFSLSHAQGIEPLRRPEPLKKTRKRCFCAT